MSTENKETAQIDALLQASCVEDYEVEPDYYLERICLAMSWYEGDWLQALNECDGMHLPGDCPLCGAV